MFSPFTNLFHTRTRVHDWKNKQKQAKNTIFSRHFWTPKIVKKWGFPQKKWGQNWKIIKSLREKVQNSLNYISWTYQGKLARFVEMIEKTQDFTNYGGGSFWKSSFAGFLAPYFKKKKNNYPIGLNLHILMKLIIIPLYKHIICTYMTFVYVAMTYLEKLTNVI